MIYDDFLRQILLGITSGVFVFFALWAATKPDSLSAVLGYELNTKNAFSEFHAIYVGVFTAQFLLCVFAAIRIQDSAIGDMAAIFLLSQPAGRVLAAIRRGLPSGFMALLFVSEIVAGILLLAVRPGT